MSQITMAKVDIRGLISAQNQARRRLTATKITTLRGLSALWTTASIRMPLLWLSKTEIQVHKQQDLLQNEFSQNLLNRNNHNTFNIRI